MFCTFQEILRSYNTLESRKSLRTSFSSRIALVLRLKTSKTFFGPVNFHFEDSLCVMI